MKRSKFNLSYTKLASINPGILTPIGLTEVLPGDTLQQATSALLRCSPLVAPVMHPWHVRIHHWYVPHRLIWDDWEDFITGGPDGMDASVFPTVTNTFGTGGLADYLGIPPGVANLQCSALPFRGYNLIWNEWYRDQDLQAPLVISTASGPDSTTVRNIQNVSWEKDYFTSARPWEQKGPSITIPIGSSAPIAGIGFAGNPVASTQTVRQTGLLPNATWTNQSYSSENAGIFIKGDAGGAGSKPEVFADLSGASAVTITALREALALQRFEEARARYGSRYVEYLRYLGVRSSDARLQRPEYLGGGKQTIQFSEVLQTAEGTDPVGEMRGHGISSLKSNRYRRYFEEHGYIFTCISVRPKTIYVQGLSRTWNRRFKEDFFQSELQHIGQQEVLNKEVYAPHANPNGIFGYQDRYDEYRRTESSVAGEFRTSVLDFWHTARIFTSDPALNASFVSCVPTERNFAVQNQDLLYVMARHSIQARRIVSGSSASFIY